MDDKQIIETFDILNIIKKYPKSGQKQVLLVNHSNYGKVILKIVQSDDARVNRELAIVMNNGFPHVPKVLLKNEYTCDNENGIYFFEEFIDGGTLREVLNEKKLSLDETFGLAETMLEIIVQMEQKKLYIEI